MIRLLLFASLSFIACGTSTADVTSTVRAKSQELQAAVDAHVATQASTSQSECSSEMQRYRDAASVILAAMATECPGLDTCMSGMGHGDQADMAAAVGDMRTELDSHVADGCKATNLAAEMTRHRQAMATHTDHLQTRTQALMGMVKTGQMMPGCH